MDNDREIEKLKQTTEIVERSKMVFLREIVNEFTRRQQQYDLEAEFAKTRKNRSIAIPLIIVGLVLVFGIVVIGVTRYIQSSSLAIRVNIDDFADVNLRDILDEAQRLQNQLEATFREIRELTTDRDTRIRQIERARDREIELLADMDLTAAQRTSREQELRTTADQEIEVIVAEVQPRLDELQERVESLEADIAQYDSRQLEQAREQEEILNNQQRLFELEMAEVREQYERQISRLTRDYEQEIDELERHQEEFARNVRNRHAEELASLRQQHSQELAALTLRFNPVMDDEAVGALIAAVPPAGAAGFTGPGEFRGVLSDEGAVSAAQYRALQEQYRQLRTLIDRLKAIPYENSVPEALEQIDLRARDLVRRYDQLWRVLGESVEDRNEIIAVRETTIESQEQAIARYKFALNELSRFQGDTGYVLDPRDSEAVVVYVNPMLSVGSGTLGYVFRRDDEFVGTIRFSGGEGTFTARVMETVEDMEVRAFDKVLIEVQGGE